MKYGPGPNSKYNLYESFSTEAQACPPVLGFFFFFPVEILCVALEMWMTKSVYLVLSLLGGRGKERAWYLVAT